MRKQKVVLKLAKKPKIELESKAMKFSIFMAFFMLFSLEAFAESKAEVFVICKLRSHVRTIAVHKKSSGGYETIYSKFGQPRVIGSGIMLDSNKGFLNNVKTNLEKSNWNCREVGDASVENTGS